MLLKIVSFVLGPSKKAEYILIVEAYDFVLP